MAKKYDIDIDSFVGGWTCNKRGIKNQLNELGEKEITVRVNSLGGDVDTAIDIASQFEAHGNIVCDLYAFNASSATILTLGAKKIRMHENGMYLIHKAMIWVDEFGHMNEDDLDNLIEKLKNRQQDSAVVTLNLARMYAGKSGKTVQEILNLMKQEIWLNAETAKQWGFVDEIFSGSIPANKQADIVEMLNCADLPIPENFQAKEESDESVTISRKDFMSEIITGIRNIFSNNNKTEPEMEKTLINAALLAAILNVQEFEAVENKVELTAEQITALENAISAKNSEVDQLKKELSAKNEEITGLNNQIKNKKAAPGDNTRDVNKENDEIIDEESTTFDNSVIESAKKLYDMIP